MSSLITVSFLGGSERVLTLISLFNNSLIVWYPRKPVHREQKLY